MSDWEFKAEDFWRTEFSRLPEASQEVMRLNCDVSAMIANRKLKEWLGEAEHVSGRLFSPKYNGWQWFDGAPTEKSTHTALLIKIKKL